MDTGTGMLVTAITALAGAIVVLWRAYLKRADECERDKEALHDAWRKDLLALGQAHRAELDMLLAEYKSLLREAVTALTAKDGEP